MCLTYSALALLAAPPECDALTSPPALALLAGGLVAEQAVIAAAAAEAGVRSLARTVTLAPAQEQDAALRAGQGGRGGGRDLRRRRASFGAVSHSHGRLMRTVGAGGVRGGVPVALLLLARLGRR